MCRLIEGIGRNEYVFGEYVMNMFSVSKDDMGSIQHVVWSQHTIEYNLDTDTTYIVLIHKTEMTWS